ncbi:MAG: sulfotransferase domain-containing protein [Gammaproteobacteria bacterium]
MAKPTFIGIGAQKCASTWIYDILADHPDVILSEKKEVDYFSYHYDHGRQWYESSFAANNRSFIAAGEISPSYFHEPAVPERILAQYPDAKILVALRDPVKRAISNHKHEIRVGHLSGDDLSLEFGLANNSTYIDQGLYAKHLQRWFEVFPREQILVLLFEDIIGDKQVAAKQIFNFLGIAENHSPAALNSQSNPSYVNKFRGLESFRRSLRQTMSKLGLDSVWTFLQKAGLQKLYASLNKKPSESVIPPTSEVTKQQLALAFREDIEKLEKMLNRDLSAWKASATNAGQNV